MSSIDLSNPQVRANWMKAQMKAGLGKFETRSDVVVFVHEDGSEMVAPAGMEEYVEKKKAAKKAAAEKKTAKKAAKEAATS